MLKVLYIVSTLERSGPIVALYNIVKYLDRSATDPVVLTLSPEPDDSMAAAFRALDIPIHSLDLSRREGVTQGPARLRRQVEQIAPHVIQSQGIRSDMLAALFLGGYPRVALLQNYAYADYRMTYGDAKGTVMAFAHLNALRRCDRAIACSHYVADMVKQHGLQRVVTIPNGVDDARFQPLADADKQALRQKLQIPAGSRVVIYVGQLSERKDPETLIRGFLASPAHERMSLLLVGGGPLLARCTELAASHANIRLVGRVTNVLDYLQAADCFVSASHAEGLPNAVLEALACGLPACLSDIPPHREFFDLGRETGGRNIGWLFDTGDAAGLARTLNTMAAADLRPLRSSALELVRRELSASIMARRCETLYRSLAPSDPRP